MKDQNKLPCFLTIAAIEYWKAIPEGKEKDSDYVKKKAYEEYERQLQIATKEV